jgi:ribosomal protein S18 acetylase RimI-like enzyme
MTGETAHATDLEADLAIMGFMRESRRARGLKRVGSFLLLFTADTKLRYLNYAIPDDGVDPAPADIDALVEAFRQADRMPRLEFLPSVAPALETRLAAYGFAVEDRLPLMTCTSSSLRTPDVPAGLRLAPPHDDATMRAMAVLQHEAFEDPEPVSDGTVAGVRRSIEGGGRAIIATDDADGTVVGAAQTMVPAGGATEIGGVAVAPSHRRRGIAAALVASLVRQSFDAGLHTVFLEAAPGADGAYRNAGFEQTSTSLHISLPG